MKEFVPEHQAIALVVLFMLGNSSISGLGARAGNDLWLAILLAIVISLPMIAIYARLRSLMHGQSLKDGIEDLFGKWPGRTLALGYGAYAWYLACLITKHLALFIQNVALIKTPQVVVVFCFAVLALWGAKAGIEVLSRWSAIFVKMVLLGRGFILVLLLTAVDFQEFLPILYDGIKPVLLGALELVDFPFLQIIILFWAFDVFSDQKSVYRVTIPGFLIAAVSLGSIAILSLGVLGTDKYTATYFPTWLALSRINIAMFLVRLEGLAGVVFSIGGFLKMAVCILVASKGFAYGFGFKDYRFLVLPLALGVIPGSRLVIKTIMDMEKIATAVVSVRGVLFQITIPLVLWIIAEIKVYARGKKKQKPKRVRQ